MTKSAEATSDMETANTTVDPKIEIHVIKTGVQQRERFKGMMALSITKVPSDHYRRQAEIIDPFIEWPNKKQYVQKYCNKQNSVELPYMTFPTYKLDHYMAVPVQFAGVINEKDAQIIYDPRIPYNLVGLSIKTDRY